ncbi:MAG: bifunctional riboflavin kinase/FAD synthetase [Melioribacteraceae bacterium]|nr:bifunctional riboflavin kinase/FAD synthetase [Melioribacteraceae bacterium]
MQIIDSINVPFDPKNSVVTVGTFDGIHIGHVEIINKLRIISEEQNLTSIIVTFFPHPRTVVNKGNDIRLLTPLEEKKKLLSEMGIDYLYVINFTEEFSKKTYKEFFDEILLNKVSARHLVIGYDHKFGKDRDGNINKLVAYTEENKMGISIVGPKEIGNETVSSTKIRNALLNGELDAANKMLGRSYSIHGKVVEGKKRGRTLGFPTANIEMSDKNKLLPKNGVYFVKVQLTNKQYFGVTNIGLRPTFNNAVEPIAEVHILDFDENIYGERIDLKIISRIRDEKKFADKFELEKQIKIDVSKVRDKIKELTN